MRLMIGKFINLCKFVIVFCRQVKLASADVVSYGGLTTCTSYHLIPKQEDVVDSVFMADKFVVSPGARPGQDESSMVIVTKNNVFSLADEDD